MPSATAPNAHQLTPYLSEEAIQARVAAMAAEINQAYANCERLIVIVVLRGSFMFTSDLVKHITVPCQIEFVRLASYGGGTTSSGNVKPVDLTLPNLNDQDVLIVEDIVDTGLTMHFFRNYLQSLHNIKSLRLAVLLDKTEARSTEIPPFPVDYAGFEVGNEFLIGYGLDYAGLYRNLPFVAVMPPEWLNN